MFKVGYDDHARNRLTHTLEVSQIARTISQYLKLDVDLTEAIALGHDLGHTPFGHVGERTLNLIMNECDPSVRSYFNLDAAGKLLYPNEKDDTLRIFFEDYDKGFKHNLQSIRVVVDLESPDSGLNYTGLNLTNFTLYGIKNHSKPKWSTCKYVKEGVCYFYPTAYSCDDKGCLSVGYYDKYNKYFMLKDENKESWSFEAFVVAWADEIAQRHHDMEDAIEGKLLTHKQSVDLIGDHFSPFLGKTDIKNFKDLKDNQNSEVFLSKLSRFLVNFLVSSLIDISVSNLKNFSNINGLKNMVDFEKKYPLFNIGEVKDLIGFFNVTNDCINLVSAHEDFQGNLKNIVLNSYDVHRMDGKAQYIIRRLFKAYLSNPQQLPDRIILSLFREFNLKENCTSNNISPLRYELEKYKTISFSNDQANGGIDHIKSINFRTALVRTICDYISGMTDSFAIKEYGNLYG